MIGLIAGKGNFPYDVAQHLTQPFVCVFLDAPFPVDAPWIQASMTRVSLILSFLKQHHVTHVVMVGAVTRPQKIWKEFDLKALWWLAQLGKTYLKGDDSLLSGLIKLIENEGFQVVAAHTLCPHLWMQPHEQGKISTQDRHDIALGLEILKSLSPYDIGQSLVISSGRVLGIEGIEGTTNLIKRCVGHNAILVKSSKLNQDMRVDVPSIGPDTCQELIKGGYRGLALHKCQIIDKDICFKNPLFFHIT
jgi:DUF1009 family protein